MPLSIEDIINNNGSLSSNSDAYAEGYKDGVKDTFKELNRWHFIKDGDNPVDDSCKCVIIHNDVVDFFFMLFNLYYENGIWMNLDTKLCVQKYNTTTNKIIAWKDRPEYPSEIQNLLDIEHATPHIDGVKEID